MGIFVDKKTKVVVQGITGRDGSFHTRQMKEYGTNVVAGVTPGKGGTGFEGIPIFNTVAEAVKKTGANTSVIYVPASFEADAILEAADAGVEDLALRGCPPAARPPGRLLDHRRRQARGRFQADHRALAREEVGRRERPAPHPSRFARQRLSAKKSPRQRTSTPTAAAA